MRQSFSSKRKVLLSLVALGLGCVWIGQTVISVLMREPYDPVVLHRWTSSILTVYFCWHVLRVAYRRPEAAIEWSDAEQKQIVGGPFSRREILLYRVMVILTSTLPKAALTALVLSPDLWWSGLPGIVAALVFLECFRLAVDIGVCCLSGRQYLIARLAVFTIVAVVVMNAAGSVPEGPPPAASQLQSNSTVFGESVQMFLALRDSALTTVLTQPFVVFANVIAAQSFSLALAIDALLVAGMLVGAIVLIERLDRIHEKLQRTRQIDMARSPGGSFEKRTSEDGVHTACLPRVPDWGGSGPLLWRQLKSAARFRGSLLVAAAIPAVLSCLPLYSIADPTRAFLAVVASVMFYSYVLLPEAVKFDFRLDCDHLAKLKMLPIAPGRIVAGQLATPVLLMTGFQALLFLFAGITRSVSPLLVVSAVVTVFPVNIFFVAIDNLIFLLYPHRPTQEGFEAFLRTVLKFTFKSLLLGMAAGILIAWAPAARALVVGLGVPEAVRIVFAAGILGITTLSAVVTMKLVSRAFARFDVSAGSAS